MLLVVMMALGATRVCAEPTDAKSTAKHNYLKAATDFAECMIVHGRDRYGEVHSPLFAVLLTREDPPRIGPYPIFDAPAQYEWQKRLESPFRKFNYNRCLNYPSGLRDEGPHKVTVYGCDVYEDRALYEMLIDLTRITGDPKYREEAEKALIWWFRNTMGPAGLYPWGEHLGWDFEHECPTYFEGPSKHLYAACFHEIKDEVPFLDILAELPSVGPTEKTLLERYALSVWNAHYWDQDKAIYCRHGDYTGQDNREGSLLGFPAHQGAHLRLWVKAYVMSKNPEVKRRMLDILTKVLDVQIARATKYGFIPFTFETDVRGKAPKKNDQSDRLGRHAAELSAQVCEQAPELAAKLKKLATLLLGEDGYAQVVREIEGTWRGGAARPKADVARLEGDESSERHAEEIMKRIEWFIEHNDPAYLQAAEGQASIAYKMFCDEKSPLPKAYPGPPRKTASGGRFPDFYFRGAKLMHSFALLGEALEERAHSDSRLSPWNQNVQQGGAADTDKPRG